MFFFSVPGAYSVEVLAQKQGTFAEKAASLIWFDAEVRDLRGH